MRFKSRCMLEGANIELVGIFERNLRFIRDRLRHSYSHLQSAGKLKLDCFTFSLFHLDGRCAAEPLSLRYTRLKSVIEAELD